MREPLVGEGTAVILVCRHCGSSRVVKPKITPASAGGFIAGLAGAIEKMRDTHECPPQPPELKLV